MPDGEQRARQGGQRREVDFTECRRQAGVLHPDLEGERATGAIVEAADLAGQVEPEIALVGPGQAHLLTQRVGAPLRLIGIAVRLVGGSSPGRGPAFLDQITDNGLFVALAALSKSATPRRVRENAHADHPVVPPAVPRSGGGH